MNIVRLVRSNQLSALESLMSKDDFEKYSREIAASQSFKTLITNVYAPLDGLKSHDEWIKRNNIGERVSQIKVPTFALGASDDLIVDEKAIPFDQVRKGKGSVLFAYSRVGGHASFITGKILPTTWYPTPVSEFFDFFEDKLRSQQGQ